MKTIEDRLRDAYRDAAETVTPDSIRQLGEHVHALSSPRARRPPRITPRFMIMPLAAASAVALIAVLTTVVVPRIIAGARSAADSPTTGSPSGRFAVAVTGGSAHYVTSAQTLTIFNALSGASIGTIQAPHRGLYFSGVATGDGRHFVAELTRPHVCRTWLYRFRLNASGHPTTLAPYPLASTPQMLASIAVSQDNRTFAYAGRGCARNGPAALAALNLRTMRATRWAIPPRTKFGSLSLTANGRVLGYDVITLAKFPRSAAYVLRTNAPAGQAASRARVVVTSGRQAGFAAMITSTVITPDGSAVYFTVAPTGPPFSARWQLRVAELRTGRTHVVGRYLGVPAGLHADPAVNRALVVVRQATKIPLPSASGLHSPIPSASPSGPGSATPSASPSGLRSPTPSKSPFGSRSPNPSKSPFGSRFPKPSNSPYGLHSPTPSVSPMVSPEYMGSLKLLRPVVRLVLVNLRTGSTTRVTQWDPATMIFSW